MSLSNWEVHELMKCPSCFFANQEKLEEMKKHHDNENWFYCGEVKGSCGYPYQRHIEHKKTGEIICHEHKDQ